MSKVHLFRPAIVRLRVRRDKGLSLTRNSLSVLLSVFYFSCFFFFFFFLVSLRKVLRALFSCFHLTARSWVEGWTSRSFVFAPSMRVSQSRIVNPSETLHFPAANKSRARKHLLCSTRKITFHFGRTAGLTFRFFSERIVQKLARLPRDTIS